MAAPIKHQIIKKDGMPIFVVVPYDEYIDLIKDESAYIPHEVVERKVMEGKSLIRAWREYKELSQKEVAKRMNISQSAYSQMEKPGANLRTGTLKKIASVLGISVEQLS